MMALDIRSIYFRKPLALSLPTFAKAFSHGDMSYLRLSRAVAMRSLSLFPLTMSGVPKHSPDFVTYHRRAFSTTTSLADSFHPGQGELRDILMSNNLMGTGSVDLEIDDRTRIATVTLNSPERRNALSGAMMMDLGSVTHELSCWRHGIGVVLKGAGKHFCSGGDLNLVKNIANSADGLAMAAYMHAVTTQFYRLPLLSVALIRGHAVGGGAELSTSCDFRLMDADARIGFVQSTMGVAPGWGGGTRLVQLLGRRRALKLLASGKVVRANEALELGLADAILDGDGDDSSLSPASTSGSTDDAAKEFILKLCGSKDTNVVRTTKMISSAAANETMEEALEIERTLFAAIWGGDAHMQAMSGNIKHRD